MVGYRDPEPSPRVPPATGGSITGDREPDPSEGAFAGLVGTWPGFEADWADWGATPQEPLRQLESDRQPVAVTATSIPARIKLDFWIIGTSFVFGELLSLPSSTAAGRSDVSLRGGYRPAEGRVCVSLRTFNKFLNTCCRRSASLTSVSTGR